MTVIVRNLKTTILASPKLCYDNYIDSLDETMTVDDPRLRYHVSPRLNELTIPRHVSKRSRHTVTTVTMLPLATDLSHGN